MGWRWGSKDLRSLIFLFSAWFMNLEVWWKNNWQEDWSSRRKSCTNVALSTINPICFTLGTNLGFQAKAARLSMLWMVVVADGEWSVSKACVCTLFGQAVGRQPSHTPSPAPASLTPWRRPAAEGTSLTAVAILATRPARNWRHPAGSGEAAALMSAMAWSSPGASWTRERLRATPAASWTYITTRRDERYEIKTCIWVWNLVSSSRTQTGCFRVYDPE